MSALPARSLRNLSRHWNGRLAAYRHHRHDEHREALVEEALRFVGFHLEDDLARTEHWANSSLARRVAVLLYLVDRGVVDRVARDGRVVYEPTAEAESWAAAQPSLAPYLSPTLELLAALRHDQVRRLESSLEGDAAE